MGQSAANQRGQVTTRRAFLKEMLALTGMSAGAALLNACGSPSATATTVPAAQQPTALATNVPAATTAATTGAEATAASTTPAIDVTAEATTAAGASATASTSQNATPGIVAAASAFLATLSDTERESVLFDWTDTTQRQRWSNLPEGLFERAGLMWGNISETRQNAWLALMQATLSAEGYNRIMAEWNADDALVTNGGGGPGGGQLQYGKQYYWIALIGTPSETDPWQWQWGGHHVTVNATIVGPNIALTPSFIGVQPGTYTDANGTTVRPLGDIEDEAFALINSLDATQQQTAILGSSSIDLVLGPGQDNKTIQAEGLPASQMNAEQQAAFLKLIGHYTGLANEATAAARIAEVQSTLDQTYLAWYGPTTQGSAAYFRVTGPTIVIEYSPQQMGGNAANHVHGIYRDPTNDYGAKYTGIVVGS